VRARNLSYWLLLTPLLAVNSAWGAALRIQTDTGEAVEFGTAILTEAKFKTNFENGQLALPRVKPGTYTLRLTAPGYVTLEERLQLPLQKDTTLVMQLQTRRTQKCG
jgi:hypothetical protein